MTVPKPHPDELTDRIAQRAAQHLVAHAERSLDRAVARAATELEAPRGTHMPAAALVRRHAQGIEMEALGQRWYEAAAAARLQHAVRAMEQLERALGAPTLLAGRAAKGYTDGDATLHVRVYTKASVAEMADALVGHGFPEPVIRTVETRKGRANELRFDLPDATVAVLRCLPDWRRDSGTDLVTGRPIATRTLEDLQGDDGPNGAAPA